MSLPIPTSYPPMKALLVGEIPTASSWQQEPCTTDQVEKSSSSSPLKLLVALPGE